LHSRKGVGEEFYSEDERKKIFLPVEDSELNDNEREQRFISRDGSEFIVVKLSRFSSRTHEISKWDEQVKAKTDSTQEDKVQKEFKIPSDFHVTKPKIDSTQKETKWAVEEIMRRIDFPNFKSGDCDHALVSKQPVNFEECSETEW